MRRRWPFLTAGLLLTLVAGYVGVFSYWWQSSPVRVYTERGRQVRDVDIHYNAVFWHTDVLWIPAFWWMEHVHGYRYVSVAAMEEQTIVTYSR
jgi:hypothetical protein